MWLATTETSRSVGIGGSVAVSDTAPFTASIENVVATLVG
jgi:hypothetical protein